MKDTLQNATKALKQISDSARLDAELLLCEAIQRNKTYLYSHPEYELTWEETQVFHQLLKQRQQGKPMAYILGRQAFWDLELGVQEGILIPRPETECLVEKVLEILPTKSIQIVADLGTGSGAIALALAKECPSWSLCATDISKTALDQAKNNAQKYNIKNVTFFEGSWCDALPKKLFDCVISNPPYIAENDPELETYVAAYEPKKALISGETGLDAINIIAKRAGAYLKAGAYLVLEHGYEQAEAVQQILRGHNYDMLVSYKDYAGKFRFTIAQNNV